MHPEEENSKLINKYVSKKDVFLAKIFFMKNKERVKHFKIIEIMLLSNNI